MSVLVASACLQVSNNEGEQVKEEKARVEEKVAASQR